MPALLGLEAEGLPYMIEEARGLALRRGSWKYTRRQGKKGGALYNLDSDIGEQRNVAKDNAATAREMEALLQKLIDAKQGIRQIDG